VQLTKPHSQEWLCYKSKAAKLMRLVTFQQQGLQEIGALTEADSKIIRLQAAEQLRNGEENPHFQSMLAFLQGANASRDAAQRTF
jgi:hypothetical protein